MRKAIIAVFTLACCLLPVGSSAEDRDLPVLKLRQANMEFAMENMELQIRLLQYRLREVKAEHAKITAEITAKEKKDEK